LERIIYISISLVIGALMYLTFVLILKTEKGRDYLGRHWVFHPNTICLWRAIMGLAGTLFYFLAGQHALGILLFTVSSVLDGVDGLIARQCRLTTPLGAKGVSIFVICADADNHLRCVARVPLLSGLDGRPGNPWRGSRHWPDPPSPARRPARARRRRRGRRP